ncbi:lipocalin family protein [uncultured Flavobacterium sp.]|uniref:lipocalin family protein n=1 Tax=uncultured Flavobacterium sp. TaxID=165435 RepID=UPI0030ED6568|tara:strand:- start:173981 stop:174397 length:417 start_codon:yes stop_codon:yes gene_type:complete
MKIKLLIAIAFTFLVSCKQAVNETDIQNLNGYWEIEKVVLPDGEDKDYKASETFDFFEVKDKAGTRKKGMQQFDGTFLTNDVSESFTIEFYDGKCFINYKTDFAKWKEEILLLNKEKLVVKNKNDLEYHYKRPVLFEK